MALQLVPSSELVFKGPFNVVSTTQLKLFNSSDNRLTFRIKTTAPKRYCVKPNSGFLDPHTSTSIQVMLQPPSANIEPQDDRSRHKFMIQWAVVPSTYTDDRESFWKQDMSTLKIEDTKLGCVFVDEQPDPKGVRTSIRLCCLSYLN